MNKTSAKSARHLAALLGIVCLAVIACSCSREQAPPAPAPVPAAGPAKTGIASAPKPTSPPDQVGQAMLAMLGNLKSQQVAASAGYQTFYQFQFTNRYAASGLTFEHRVVDDAGKDWMAGHYDHGNGVAVADVDGDGKLDIYFVNQWGTNQLARGLGNGRFEDITATAGVGLAGRIGSAAGFADIDNDGDPDLFVTSIRYGNTLFENLGGGKFKDISKEAGLDYVGHSAGMVFFDFDRDGLLDLFVCNVGKFTTEEKGRGGFYLTVDEAFAGHTHPDRIEYSILYRNLGENKFKDVSQELNLRDASWSGDASIVDINQDGYPDLYVLNMQGDDHFYLNLQGKRFEDRTSTYFPKTPWGAMGLKFFDFNNDGQPDLYIVDMHSDMTDKQTADFQSVMDIKLDKQKSEAWCSIEWSEAFLQGSRNNIFGNALYLNQGNGKFTEESDRRGAETYWPWGVTIADLNADGFEDAFVNAGMGHPFRYSVNSVLLNEQGRRFVDSEFLLNVEPRKDNRIEKVYFTLDCSGADRNHEYCAGRTGNVDVWGYVSTRSSVSFDLDDDGDLDVITAEMHDFPIVLVSNLTEHKKVSFLKVKLVGTKSNRDAIGATVRLHAGGKVQTRWNDGKSGYLAMSSIPLYFGLGDVSRVDRLEIEWPSGRKQTVTEGLTTNQLLVVTEPKD